MEEFQALEWLCRDEPVADDAADDKDDELMRDYVPLERRRGDDDSDDTPPSRFRVCVFGRTAAGDAVTLVLRDYAPYFYIRVPDRYGNNDLLTFLKFLQWKFQVGGVWQGRNRPVRRFAHPVIVFNRQHTRVVRRTDAYGFKGGEQQTFFRLAFMSQEAMRAAVSVLRWPVDIPALGLKGMKFDLYESNIDLLVRVIKDLDEAESTGWLAVPRTARAATEDRLAPSADVELHASWRDVRRVDGRDDVARFVQASFDIECFSPTGAFPVAEKDTDCVTQIGTTFKAFGDADDSAVVRTIVTLKACPPIAGVDVVRSFDREADLLLGWADLVRERDPDVLLTYNGDTFDCAYLWTRAGVCGVQAEFARRLSRLAYDPATLVDATFKSSAYGESRFRRLCIPGRVNFDVLVYIRRNFKLESYKLDDVAKTYLGLQKHDVTPKDIFALFEAGTPDDIRRLAEYCVQDCILPQKLMDKLHVFIGQVEMARNVYVPFRYLSEKGQQVKVISRILRSADRAGFLLPEITKESEYRLGFEGLAAGSSGGGDGDGDGVIDLDDIVFDDDADSDSDSDSDADAEDMDIDTTDPAPAPTPAPARTLMDLLRQPRPAPAAGGKATAKAAPKGKDATRGSYQGATVLPPITGAYMDAPVTVLDFESLYPSIIMAHGLCYTTIVTNDRRYGAVPGVTYKTFEWSAPGTGQTYRYKFAQGQTCLLPGLLEDLKRARKAAKRQMATATDPFLRAIYNAKQLAVKVTMNSVYGFLAAYIFRCMPIAAVVTTIGRSMINTTKNWIEREFRAYAMEHGLIRDPDDIDPRIVAGDTDSVFIDFRFRDLVGRDALPRCFDLGRVCARVITETKFIAPISLEFEKVYWPYVSMAKKRYIGAYWTSVSDKYDKIDAKGIDTVRRETPQIVKDLLNGISHAIMNHGRDGVAMALECFHRHLQDIIEGRVPPEGFQQSKTLRGDYKNPDSQPHDVVARKIAARDPGAAPHVNDRVRFLYVVDPARPMDTRFQHIALRAEDPAYVREHGLPIDILYYIERTLRKPTRRLVSSFIPNVDELIDEYVRRYKMKRENAARATFFKPRKPTPKPLPPAAAAARPSPKRKFVGRTRWTVIESDTDS